MSFADIVVNKLDAISTKLDAIAAVPSGSTDLTPVLTAVADIKTDVAAVAAELKVTPVA